MSSNELGRHLGRVLVNASFAPYIPCIFVFLVGARQAMEALNTKGSPVIYLN